MYGPTFGNVGSWRALISMNFEPRLTPPLVCGLRRKTGGMAPEEIAELANASEPIQAAARPPPLRSPLNFNLIGMPLANCVMPDICQPLSAAFVNQFLNPPRAPSGMR